MFIENCECVTVILTLCRLEGEKKLRRDSLPTLYLPHFGKRSTETISLYTLWKSRNTQQEITQSDIHMQEPISLPDPLDIASNVGKPSGSGDTISTFLPVATAGKKRYKYLFKITANLPFHKIYTIKCAVRIVL
ncbi:hypothetical protein ABEB36_014584 [Hypothenemus hampei]|uniref:Uncharacterized protein n=1 Tax=Hypothenemus hampei TaxID=57062 RepID=A0ABD1E6V2_HYPHA